MFVMLDRGDYWQCAFVIPKGGFERLRGAGLDGVPRGHRRARPAFCRPRAEIALLGRHQAADGAVDRLKRWYRPGLLCIGDAAHAMSPVGGVGINLAIQDAVAAANMLAEPLREGRWRSRILAKVQRRREWPTRMTQAVQLFVQKRIISSVLAHDRAPAAAFRW